LEAHSRGITVGSAECLQTLFDAITTNRAEPMIETTFSINGSMRRRRAIKCRDVPTASHLAPAADAACEAQNQRNRPSYRDRTNKFTRFGEVCWSYRQCDEADRHRTLLPRLSGGLGKPRRGQTVSCFLRRLIGELIHAIHSIDQYGDGVD
jgi:hypothetical protein